MARHEHESAMEYLRRIVSNLDYEPESILDDLPSIPAIVEYFELFDTYGTDFMSGIEECILDGADPKPLADFIKKWELPWTQPKDWKARVAQ